MKKIDFDLQDVLNIYTQEKTATPIAKKYNCSHATVCRFLKDNGIELYGPIDLLNKEFGRLTVKNKKYIDGLNLWECECSCGSGKLTYHTSTVLVKNRVVSCGCINKSKRFIPGGYEDISGAYWRELQSNASKRGLEFSISIEYAWNLYLKQEKRCALSGIPITMIKKNYYNKSKLGIEKTASLDRIDSSKGYIEDNLQWVHKWINFMKSDFSQEEFIKFCILVAENNKTNQLYQPTS